MDADGDVVNVTYGWSLDVSPRRPWTLLASLVLGAAIVMPATVRGAETYDPATDPYSMARTAASSGAAVWWAAGYTGAGVDVAVIDTGTAPVPGLSAPGKVVNGPDLSLESQKPALRFLDTNGHGTFMAGLIAGKSATYWGIAPDARIVSVKVGVADGGVDVSQVIAAIDWVVQHRRDNGLNIRVINLSYGTNTTQASAIDPLSFAVEQAWKAGIVVVAAAGNSGYQQELGLANPAYNPFVIAVGGYDTAGTASITDDQLGRYSAGVAHTGDRAPDFSAIGSHLQGLRVPNSWIDSKNPRGRLGSQYFRGSGTSQAAAITSGAVALVLQRYPVLTPDQVKQFLVANVLPAAGRDPDPDYWGAGRLNLGGMLLRTPPASRQTWASSTGTGSLEAARGTDRVTDDGVVLAGEIDVFGSPFNSITMATAEAAGTSWSGGTWNGNTWSGNTWSGNTWSGNTWSGSSWSGNTWSGNTWSGNTWSGSSWSGNTWSGNSWSGNTWSGNSWSGGSWD